MQNAQMAAGERTADAMSALREAEGRAASAEAAVEAAKAEVEEAVAAAEAAREEVELVKEEAALEAAAAEAESKKQIEKVTEAGKDIDFHLERYQDISKRFKRGRLRREYDWEANPSDKNNRAMGTEE